MTEFEIATIAFQNATVESQNATIAFQNATVEFQDATIAFQNATVESQNATIAFQNAALAIDRAALAIDRAGLWVAVAQVAATVVIGLGQIAVVWYGIRAMQRTGNQRAREQDQRHDEAMTALRQQGAALETLIARTAN